MPYKDPEKQREHMRKWKRENKEKVKLQVRRHQWRKECKKNGVDAGTPMPDGYKPEWVIRSEQPRQPKTVTYRPYQHERSLLLGIDVSEYTTDKWVDFRAKRKVEMQAENALKAKARQREDRKKTARYARDWVWNYKTERCCERCRFKHPAALHFHHKRDKHKDISRLSTIASIKREIEKCELLCANCHAVEHYDERQSLLLAAIDVGTPST